MAAAAHGRPGYDWFHFYYRDRAYDLGVGGTALEHLLPRRGCGR